MASEAVQKRLDTPEARPVGAASARRGWMVPMGLFALLAIGVLVITLVLNADRLGLGGSGATGGTRNGTLAQRPPIDPAIPRPAVEPVIFKPIEPKTAMEINAAVPFSTAPRPAARRFIVTGSPESLARALDCLATAAYYEAGDDTEGQRAVVQVVLNRVRHPSFPKTICGVVFQGSERVTGCQFSFTCDGSIDRHHPSAGAWTRAQAVATAALAGRVYAPIGYATHYHTDWVVPYWSASLDKIAAVKTHLFFRWAGAWGTPRAFYARAEESEPVITRIAAFSKAHLPSPTELAIGNATAPPAAAEGDQGTINAAIAGSDQLPIFAPTASNPNIFLVALPASIDRERYPALADQACGSRPRCVFMAWKDPSKVPPSLPASTSQLQEIAFHFVRDPVFATPRSRWNCAMIRRPDPQQCLSHQVAAPPPQPALAAALRPAS